MRTILLLAAAFALLGCNAGPRVVIHEVDDNATPKGIHTAPASTWEYRTDGDTTWACSRSADNAAELCFRRSRGHLDSYMHLPSREGNPFFCQRGRCATKLSVDGASETVQGTDDEAGGTRILFLPNPQKFLQQVEHAKEIRMSPPMFGVDQEFVFEVSGLKWL